MLASDGESSYALFLYDDIQWSQADLRSSGSGMMDASGSGRSGLMDGSGASGTSGTELRLVVGCGICWIAN